MQSLTAALHSVSEQIRDISAAEPQWIALSCGSAQISYGELNSKANEFASRLSALGVVPGSTVAICLERSFDTIIAALGVIRLGAAYLPLDPAWPDTRLKYCIENSNAQVLVARQSLAGRLKVEAANIDPLLPYNSPAPLTFEPSYSVDPESVAYVIYTSGSSGKPKGVEITISNLSHLIAWHRGAFRLTPSDRVSHLAGLGFDAAVWEIWCSLATGCTLCLASDEVRSSPQLIQQWLVSEGITVSFVPTVHVPALMKMEWPVTTSLRLLLTGGDTLLESPPIGLPFEVVNNYGPTECTVVATSGAVVAGSDRVPSIGQPIEGAVIRILNDALEQVNEGEAGEIFIAGNGVGKGYRNFVEASGYGFVPDPFSNEPGSRMYRTGDRGRRLLSGEIQFLGRVDRQTKIRGQRVELDEISIQLNQHPMLEFGTVIAATSPANEKFLVAYYKLLRPNEIVSVSQMQEYLLERLPDYMVPGVFIQISTIPVSANGKIDLGMLPAPVEPVEAAVVPSDENVTAIEQEVLATVRGLLNGRALQLNDNFFLAGGHSLLGMQLILKIRKTFQVELTLRQLFEAPTPARLAGLIDTLRTKQLLATLWKEILEIPDFKPDQTFFELGGTTALAAQLQKRISHEFHVLIPIADLIAKPTIEMQVSLLHRSVSNEPALPGGVMALQPLGSQKGIFWVHYLSANLAKLLGTERPFLHVSLTADDFGALGDAPTMERIASCFVAKIRATQPEGPYTLGGFCLGGILAYEIAIQLREAGQEISHLVLIDPPSPNYFSMPDPLAPRFFQWNYIRKRAFRLGLRTSMRRLRDRLLKGSQTSLQARLARAEIGQAQDMIQDASFRYKPRKYDGQVLMFLATERPPHVDFLPGWEAMIPNSLESHYIDAHHSELTREPSAVSIAAKISSLSVSALSPVAESVR